MGNKLLNTKISILISFLSGISFLALLAFTPLRPLQGKKPNKIFDEVFEKQQKPESKELGQIEKKDSFQVNLKKILLPELNEIIAQSGTTTEVRDIFNNQNRQILNFTNDSMTYYKNDKLAFSAISESRISNSILEYKYQNRLVDQNQIFQNKNTYLKNMELSYQLNSSFNVNLKSSQYDLFDDRMKSSPTTMAGVSYNAGKIFSTGVVAGESSFINSGSRFAQQTYLNGNNFYKDSENLYRDQEKNQRGLFEWNANLTPTKNILFQTSLYNSNKSYINETNSSEGARFTFAYGLSFVMLNLRYNYLSDNLARAITRPDLPSVNNKDFAALGFTFFLDASKRLSVYLGNNYHNIVVNKNLESANTSIPNQTSFSASIRGKTSEATFFWNFKNSYNRDFFYSNIGVFRIPVNSQLNLDYATSLGMELSF